SLSFPYNKGFAGWNNDGLHVFGEEDDGHGYGEVFFRRNNRTDPSSLSIYFEERQREVDRVKRLVNAQPTYELKLKTLVESRAGQKIGGHRFWREYLKIHSNEYEDYYLFRKDQRAASSEIEEPMLNLWPWSKDEVSAFNNYLIGLFNDWRENPGKYHWLWSPSFEVFDFDTCFVLSLTC